LQAAGAPALREVAAELLALAPTALLANLLAALAPALVVEVAATR